MRLAKLSMLATDAPTSTDNAHECILAAAERFHHRSGMTALLAGEARIP